MRLQSGKILNLSHDNAPVPGCTVSEQVYQGNGMSVFIFSLAPDTNISVECYGYHKVLLVLSGEMEVFTTDHSAWPLTAGDSFVTPLDLPFKIKIFIANPLNTSRVFHRAQAQRFSAFPRRSAQIQTQRYFL